ncbi:hypothetical protein MRB53_041551 [Persea americana]|nr:hypothetical protein MRB53_041551 [Persea americana]
MLRAAANVGSGEKKGGKRCGGRGGWCTSNEERSVVECQCFSQKAFGFFGHVVPSADAGRQGACTEKMLVIEWLLACLTFEKYESLVKLRPADRIAFEKCSTLRLSALVSKCIAIGGIERGVEL